MTSGTRGAELTFIIGAARSGTKFLRDTLAAAPSVAAVPYDTNYIWRRGNESLEHDELKPGECSLAHASGIRRDVTRQALRGHRETANVVLEKTVSNALRVPFLERVAPGARYICLLRDGRDVVESAYRCWRQPPDYRYLLQKARTFPLSDWRYALQFVKGLIERDGGKRTQRTWGPVYRGMLSDLESEPLEVVVARQWQYCVEASLSALDALPSERVLTLRFENMTASPDWIPKVMAFIGCGRDADAVIASYHETLRMPSTGRWSTTFSEEQRTRIWTEIGETVARLGYEAEGR